MLTFSNCPTLYNIFEPHFKKESKLRVERNGKSFYALGFGLPTIGCQFTEGDVVDIVCSADINEFRGNRSVQLVIKDIKFTNDELNNYLNDGYTTCSSCGG